MKWKPLACMKTTRYNFGATVIGEKIYVAGGFDSDCERLSSAEVYDSKSNEWLSSPNMNEKRVCCCVTSINGKVYVVGGFDGGRRRHPVKCLIQTRTNGLQFRI